MDKLVVHTDDGSTQEFSLSERRISIGRDETNTICLGDKSVSRHHATLQRVLKGFTIEDAQSTNGTRVNGRVITKQYLKHRDLIEIGKYHLRYFEVADQAAVDDPDKTVVFKPVRQSELKPAPIAVSRPASRPPAPAEEKNGARVRYLSGPQQGEELWVDRSFFTVGKPGGDLVLINRRHTGYYLLKVGGENIPMINGNPIKAGGVELHTGDHIDLGELSLEFVN
jgi:pSer/pThr/pTyr-binding forkhead associated (FHA) protein